MAMVIPPAVLEFSVAAIKAVMVVPMFAPIIKGAACLSVVIRLATMGTTTDVVMVLDRIAAVVSRPPQEGLELVLKEEPAEYFGRAGP